MKIPQNVFRSGVLSHCSQRQKCLRRSFSDATSGPEVKQSTVYEENRKKFDDLVDRWWHPDGEFRALASMNALRVPMVRDGLLQTMKLPEPEGSASGNTFRPLEGFRILDVGCGGGLLSEPLARLGARVTGIDPTPGSIDAARKHADLDPDIRDCVQYEAVEIEKLMGRPDKFDAVVASEVIEHVQNFSHFVKSCVDLTKDGGSLFFTTINRTALSLIFAKVAAEYILRIVPAGLHDWNMFLPPQQLQEALESNGCFVRLIHGTFYNPLTNSWSWVKNSSITYALHAIKHTG
ncbi:ubiquinone biosynthesis O-methyltransferase, mitochondrial-like [Ornithodoros turicata]